VKRFPWLRFATCSLALLMARPWPAAGQAFDPGLFSDMRWRLLGPFRGGWSLCAEGIPEQPNTFYFGAAVGGIWRTDDAGETWAPLFQHETAAAIGTLAIAPSDPKIVYVGTGQVSPRYDVASGDGVFRSDDGGKSWRRLGLEATRSVGRILVDPRAPDVVLVAALGHFFGPNPERGVFRSEDGGKTWTKTLFVDENTGAVDLARDPEDPAVVYAASWQARVYPWLSYFQPVVGPGSGVYRSNDGGRSWKRLSGGGFPGGDLGRIGLATAAGGRVFALVDAAPETRNGGLYRSDDGGATWQHVNGDRSLAGWYAGRITSDPANRDSVYVVGRSLRHSDDAGSTFRIVKGGPGGDDYHFLWINPKHPAYRVLASDQGTVVSVNGGKSWSGWYNQPTGQFYHLETDDRFPYWIYSGQQDSGTVGIASRSDYGAPTYREWHPVGGDERGWDVPDPADPEIVYGTGLGGALTRYDNRTGQVQDISPSVVSTYGRRPTEVEHRYTWITPLAISRRPPHSLYFAAQVLFRSDDRGKSWQVVSPDLTGAVPGTKGCGGAISLANARACGFGVIYSLSLSPQDEREIWAGTDDGLIQLTRDGGKSWRDVTPPGLPVWSKIASLEASPLEAGTAYAAVDGHRLDDLAPRAYRTHDWGRTWTPIAAGLPPANFISVVRADPVRKGLLYAGTNAGVFVSFDDGGHWQSLQSNLPTTWVRDLAVHGEDLIAATQGRAIWVLDDVTPLRQITAAVEISRAHLYEPAPATRLRRDENRDTPLPPEIPIGQNPPAGAVIDYWLKSDSRNPVTLEILDAAGSLIRRYSSADPPEEPNAFRYFAEGWLKPFNPLSAAAGHHRFVWDLRLPRPKAAQYGYTTAAVYGVGTQILPEGVLALPGNYAVRLTVDGKSSMRTLRLRMDPRITTPETDLRKQFELAGRITAAMDRDFEALQQVRALRGVLKDRRASTRDRGLSERLAALDTRAASLESGPEDAGFARWSGRLATLLNVVTSADAPPTAQAIAAFDETEKLLSGGLASWEQLVRQDVPALNEALRGAGLSELPDLKAAGAALPPPGAAPDNEE